MCDRHTFQFDVDKAYEDQLVSVLEASPEHPLSAPEAPRQPGIYVLFCRGLPVYVGQAQQLRSRLNDHLKKIENRKGISAKEVTCRFLTMKECGKLPALKTHLSAATTQSGTEFLGSVCMFLGEGDQVCPGM